MLKLAVFILIVASLTAGVSWVGEHEGTLTVVWLGYEITTTILMALSALGVAIALSILFIELNMYIWRTPQRLKQRSVEHKHDATITAITSSLTALITHDSSSANKATNKAAKLLSANKDHQPLAELLHASAASLAGKNKKAVEHYNKLLESPITQLAGLKGLLNNDIANDDMPHALQLAKKAFELQPSNADNIMSLLTLYQRSKQWDEAELFMQKIGQRKWQNIIGKKPNFTETKANIVLMRALKQKNEGNTSQALELAQEAHKLNNGLIPACVLAAELANTQEQPRICSTICTRTWAHAPHPSIAELYLAPYAEEKPKKYIARAKKLASGNSNHPESAAMLAKAYLKSDDFSQARNHTKLALGHGETAELCKLMAGIEQADPDGSNEIAREWRTKAGKAVVDSAWYCSECGFIAENWSAECGHCEKTGTSMWNSINTHNPVASQQNSHQEAPLLIG